MRKYLIGGTLFILAALGLALMLHYRVVPAQIEKSLTKAARNYGFEKLTVQRVESKPGTVTFHKVSLDDNEFTRIEKITLNYYTFSFLFGGRLERAIIEGPELSLDILGNGDFSITGLPGGLPQEPFSGLTKIHMIKIINGTADVFQNELGSLRFHFDGESYVSESGHHEPQMRIKTAQKRLSADITMQGQIEPKGQWNLNFDINGASLETDHTSFNRITASMNCSGTSLLGALTTGELNIGSMNLHGTLWQNVNGTFEASATTRNLMLSGQSNNNENLEITLSFDSEAPEIIRTALYGKTFTDLIDFGRNQKIIGDITLPSGFAQMPEVTAQLEWPVSGIEGTEYVPVTITNYNYGVDLLYYAPATQQLRNKPQTAHIKTSGTISAIPIGNGMTLKNGGLHGTMPLSGKDTDPITLVLDNTELHLGALRLLIPEPLQIKLPLKSLSTSVKNITTMLPLSQGIKQHGLMDVTLNDAQISTINKINIDLNGPLLEIKNAASLPINATVDIRMIDINDFFKTLPYEGIYAEGHIGGKLELEITENAITVQSGALNSLGEGRIHINPRWTNLLLGSDNHDASQTANALKNFEFNSINITMTGNLLATPHITIELNGHTPSMFDGKDFSMTLDFEKPIEQFFAPILMNGPE